MRKATRRYAVISLAMFGAFIAAGCGAKFDAVTGDLGGRRASLFDVADDWLVYSWTPPVDRGRPVHLVVRNLRDGAETELESDWYGTGLAVDAGRVAYERRGSSGSNPEIVLYDIGSGTQTVVMPGSGNDLDFSGDSIVWTQQIPRGLPAIVHAYAGSRQWRYLDAETRPGRASDEYPRVDGATVVWERNDREKNEHRLYVHNVAANSTTPTDVAHPGRIAFDFSDGRIVYRKSGEETIHLYDVASGTDRVVAEAPRLREGPYIKGATVVWTTHIPRDEFKPVSGQKLIDEKDFRNLFRHNPDTGTTTELASNVFLLRRATPANDGRVYALVPRRVGTGSDVISDICRW